MVASLRLLRDSSGHWWGAQNQIRVQAGPEADRAEGTLECCVPEPIWDGEIVASEH